MKHLPRPYLTTGRVLTVALFFCVMGMFSASVLANQTPAGASLVGDDACMDCHDEVGTAWPSSLHGSVSELTDGIACESCHGPGSAHAEEQDPALIINPAKSSQFDGAMTCQGCHNTAEFDDWDFSHHNNADVNCASCHTVHISAEKWAAQDKQLACLTCHTEVGASMFMPSRHPIREGYVTCNDCHNPHGGETALMHENSTRELCFTCHPEKEGPFVFEHAPAEEDCMICHTPHGSVADNLLKANEPTLCLNCHAMHFHASLDGYEGDYVQPQTGRTGTSEIDSWKKGMLTKCTTCHSGMHGTDLPSQSISTGGNGLTR